MEKDSHTNLKWFFDQWIYKPGFPVVNGTWHYNKSLKKLALTFFQTKPGNPVFRLPVDIKIIYDKSQKSITKDILLDKKENKFEFTISSLPDNIILDPDHYVLMNYNLKQQ